MNTAKKLQFVIPDTLTGKRLDAALAELSGFSRSSLARLFKEGHVTVEGHLVDRDAKAMPGQIIDLVIPAKQTERKAPDIIAETDDYIVINKPAGLLVHEKPGTHSAREREYTIADWVGEHLTSTEDLDATRPGIIHRLDRDVSGVMLIAKHAKAAEYLKQQFAARKVTKIYTALVFGIVKDDAGTITFPLARSKRTGRVAARPSGSEGREALTEYTVLERRGSSTLLSVQIKTGRMHQIRSHLLAIGHPIVGDTVYGASHTAKAPTERLMLHSTMIGFADMTGKWQEYRVDVPKEFEEIK